MLRTSGWPRCERRGGASRTVWAASFDEEKLQLPTAVWINESEKHEKGEEMQVAYHSLGSLDLKISALTVS